MEWTKPACIICKKEIETPHDAIYLSFNLEGDNYAHISCYANEIINTLKIVPGIRFQNISDMIDEAKSGSRTRMQGRVSMNFFYSLGISLLLSALGLIVVFGTGGKADVVVFLCGMILALLGIIMLGATLIGIWHLLQFEAILKATAKK